MASGLHPVVPAMKARAMSQARSGSAWWEMVPKNPHSRFWVCGISVLLAISAAPVWRGLVPCA